MATAVKQQTSLKISDLFQVFVRERELLKNVSPNTLIWHQQSYRAFQPFIGTLDIDDDLRGAVKAGIGNLAGHLKASSVNGYVRSMNAFFNWLHAEGYVKDRLKFGRLPAPTKHTKQAQAELVAHANSATWPTRTSPRQIENAGLRSPNVLHRVQVIENGRTSTGSISDQRQMVHRG